MLPPESEEAGRLHKLVAQFLALPFRHQIAVAQKLKILTDEDFTLRSEPLFEHMFKRVKVFGLLEEFQKEIERRYAHPEAPSEAPPIDTTVGPIADPPSSAPRFLAVPPTQKKPALKTLIEQGTRQERKGFVILLADYLLTHNIDADITLELLQGWNTRRVQPPLSDEEVIVAVNGVVTWVERQRAGTVTGIEKLEALAGLLVTAEP